MNGTEDQWRRLAEAMTARMRVVGMSPAGLARASGRSPAHVTNVLGAKKTQYRDEGLFDLAKALGWSPRSIELAMDGQSPEVGRSPDPEVTVSADGVDLSELRRVDPAAYEKLMDDARWLLARARERRSDG